MKLRNGVPMQRILSDVRDKKVDVFGRTKILELKDLQNIVRDFNINYATKRHEDDKESIRLWVQECQLQQYCPVLLYKNQGDDDPENKLLKEDFVLIIMTEHQQLMLSKFGGDKICTDGTHGTNNYYYQLYTLMVIDEYAKGVAGAFMISNRADQLVFEIYYSAIRSKCGVIICTVFMSDDYPAFYNAWAKIMGETMHRLICSWHVDQNWQRNLSKISDKSKRKHVYKTLKTLMEEVDEETFKKCLKETVKQLEDDPDTKSFGTYFKKEYENRPEVWAFCYRLRLGINTNNYLESLHRVIKYCYLEGKKVKRMDKTTNALLNVSRDQLYRRLTALAKNRMPAKEKKIKQSHKKALAIIVIEQHEKEGSWVVQSENKKNEYLVEKAEIDCPFDFCGLKCKECKICIHSYTCTCMDNVINFNICKHIHACCMKLSISNETENIENVQVNEVEARENEFFKSLLTLPQPVILQNTDDELRKNLKVIDESISGLDEEEKSEIRKCVDKMLSICNRKRRQPLQEREKINIRSKIDKQEGFFPTRKKNKVAEHIKKPTTGEKKEIINGLNLGLQIYRAVHTKNDAEHEY